MNSHYNQKRTAQHIQRAKHALQSQSTPHLHAVANVDYAFPISSQGRSLRWFRHNEHKPQTSATIKSQRNDKGVSRLSHSLCNSKSISRTGSMPVFKNRLLQIDQHRTSPLHQRIKLIESRSLQQLMSDNKISSLEANECAKIIGASLVRETAVLESMLEECFQSLEKKAIATKTFQNDDKKHPNNAAIQKYIDYVTDTRTLLAFCLNRFFSQHGAGSSMVPIQARFLQNTFTRYDDLFEAMRFLISANRHQSVGEQHRELLVTSKELHTLKSKYEDLIKTMTTTQSVLAQTQREKLEIEHQLEKYRKWAYVKTGRLSLDQETWTMPLFELPSMQYMKSKNHVNDYTSTESMIPDPKQLLASLSRRGGEDVEEVDEEDKHVVKENVQLCLDDLEKHSVQMQQLLHRAMPSI